MGDSFSVDNVKVYRLMDVNDLNGDGKADKLDLAEIRKLIIS